MRQIGRGLHGRFRGSYLMLVQPKAVKEENKTKHTTLVTPVAAVEEKAIAEYKEEKERKKNIIKLLQKPTKNEKNSSEQKNI